MPVTAPLCELVMAYCADRPGQALKPNEIARGITATLDGRHIGTAAVRNCCMWAVSTGRLVLVAEAPMTFAFPDTATPADERDTTPS